MDVAATLGVGELTGILLLISGFTVWAVNRLRSELYEHTKWAARVPSWGWWSLSFAIPLAICYALSLDLMQTIAANVTDGMVDLDTGYGPVMSAIVVTASSNGTFSALKKAGFVAEKPTPAEPVIPDSGVSVNREIPYLQLSEQAELYMRVNPPTNGPNYYVYVGGVLHPVQAKEESDLD